MALWRHSILVLDTETHTHIQRTQSHEQQTLTASRFLFLYFASYGVALCVNKFIIPFVGSLLQRERLLVLLANSCKTVSKFMFVHVIDYTHTQIVYREIDRARHSSAYMYMYLQSR